MNNHTIRENIDKHGWQFQYVFDSNGVKEQFAYSIGFEQTFNHPEIMIFGLSSEIMYTSLSNIASEIKSGVIFNENVRIDSIMAGDFEVMFKAIKEECLPQYAGIALRYYKKPIRVLVMFWPDKSNVLPIEPGCTLTVQNEAIEIV